MAALTARLFPQAHALFEWLEPHAQIRCDSYGNGAVV